MSVSASWPIRSFPNLRSKPIRANRPFAWLTVAVLLLFSGCAIAAEAEVRIAVPVLPAQLDPHKAASLVDRSVAAELFLGLVTRDAQGAVVPGAAAWQVGSDGLSYIFTLKDGLSWSDGKPLKAGDFVAGLSRARDAATAAPFAALLGPIAAMEAPDDKTVKILLAQPSASLLVNLSQPVAAPLPRHRWEVLGDAWAAPKNIVTNGPAVVQVDAHAESGFVLATRAAKISFHAVPAAEAAAALVRDGDAEMTLGFGFEFPNGSVGPVFQTDRAQNLYFVAANTARAPLNVREVRHALGMAIDRDAILKALPIQSAAPAYAMVPAAAYETAAHGAAPYAALRPDMRAAVAEVLLSEQKIDTSHPVTLSLIYPKGAVHAAVAKNLAAAWVVMGVHLRLQEQDMGDYLQNLRDGVFDLALATGEATDTRPLAYLAPFLPSDPRNIMRYSEPDFLQRMQAADAASDSMHHLSLLSEAEAVLIEDQPVLPILYFLPARPVAGHLKGWAATTTGHHPLYALSR